ncbi:MAG: hypothetical protein ABI847_05895, partial [Anaerolineales bacterium]
WTLVTQGVSSFYLVPSEYKVFWNTAPPIVPPHGPQAPADANGETISRIASYGSSTRELYRKNFQGDAEILSNIVADADYVYFTTANGLMRLSVNANPGDAPELLNGLYGVAAELAIDDTNIFVLDPTNHRIDLIPKATPLSGYYEVTGTGNNPANLQVSFSFSGLTTHYFVYWLESGNLKRYDIGNFTGPITLATSVTGYYAEGGRTFSCGLGCLGTSDLVFYGVGQYGHYYNNLNSTPSGVIYTSADSTAQIQSFTTDDTNLYLIERYSATCGIFICYSYGLLRTGRGSDTQALLYNSSAISGASVKLTTDGTYLYWQDPADAKVKRLANNASTLARTNMRVTGLELTQGVQFLNNSVELIQNRRTFVRMYVQSDGPSVPAVNAQLEATWNGGSSDFPLEPINPTKPPLTVQAAPDRNNIDQSFLFELPLDWTNHTNLTLMGELNANKSPLQLDYSNNNLSAGPINFFPSARVVVNLVQFSYTMTSTTYTTPITDTNNAISLVRRLWPIASTPGNYQNGTPGFRPRLFSLFDAGLGARMNYSADECNDYLTTVNGMVVDKRNLCASSYADNRLKAYRSELGLPDDSFLYGLIPSGGGFTVRGQAFSADRVSSGDSANAGTAAHEITHTAGRSHPFQGSSLDDNKCGNTPQDGAIDNSYPYADSSIGPSDNSLEGFDPGDPSLKISMAVNPSAQWFDIISYCGPRWISDYTYANIYSFFPHVQAPSPLALAFQLTPASATDWLSAYGVIAADGLRGSFDHLRRLSSVAHVPSFTAGPYSLRLLDSHGVTLHDYPFAPDVTHHGDGVMDFGLEVPFVAGTAQIELIKSPSQVLASQTVSAHAPTVSNVALQSPPNPVAGTVTLGWSASDLDGDPLTFDVLFTRDGGVGFSPLLFGISGSQTTINTSDFGGGPGRFRVIASDGLQTGQADSPTYTFANKPPEPHIDAPGNGQSFHWGQLVALLGEANDPQGVGISDNHLVWTDQRGDVLGTGSAVYTTSLPVGTDVITLTATNNLNQSAATHITVTVGDDLKPLGPTLSVAPSQINWQVTPGTVASQTSQVALANVGSGGVNWTASSDQSWLTLNALSGSAPFTLTVSANPVGMINGQIRTAHITLIKPADSNGPEQDIVVAVQLAMGDIESAPVGVTVLNRHVYLPLIER